MFAQRRRGAERSVHAARPLSPPYPPFLQQLLTPEAFGDCLRTSAPLREPLSSGASR